MNNNTEYRELVRQIIEKYINAPVNETTIGAFANDVYEVLNTTFHADDDFADYVSEDGVPVFTVVEAQHLDAILVKMWAYCDKKHIDIHELYINPNVPVQTELNEDESEEDFENEPDDFGRDDEQENQMAEHAEEWLDVTFMNGMFQQMFHDYGSMDQSFNNELALGEYSIATDKRIDAYAKLTDVTMNVCVRSEDYDRVNAEHDEFDAWFSNLVEKADLSPYATEVTTEDNSMDPEASTIIFTITLTDNYLE